MLFSIFSQLLSVGELGGWKVQAPVHRVAETIPLHYLFFYFRSSRS